jgi:phospholipase/carboxylesterase
MQASRLDILGVEALSVLSNDPTTAVVMLHGYGANMHDLFPLWQMWDNGKFNWYFPNGTQSLPMGYYEGRAWFSIDVAALEQAMREGRHRDLSVAIPPEFDLTLKELEGFLMELGKRHERIILGGFSQGAMCAFHLAMMPHLKIAGLILLSGNLLAESRLPASAKGLPFYQAHGTNDPILPLTGAKLLEEKLLGLNFSGKLHAFPGGHEIPMDVIQGVKAFLTKLES